MDKVMIEFLLCILACILMSYLDKEFNGDMYG